MNRRAEGIALISVLLMVAVATTVAYQVATRHALTVAQSRQALDGSQARLYALGGEEYARQLLYQDWEDAEGQLKDTLLEAWAGVVPEEEDEPPWGRAERQRPEADGASYDAVEQPPAGGSQLLAFDIDDGGRLQVRIDDLSGRFNLNAVAGSDGAGNLVRLKRLLTSLGVDENAADAWRDWIDDDEDVQGFGAEDADMLLRDPPGRASNQRAVHTSEFMAATGLPAQQFGTLAPHVAALPLDEQRVNVNTASAVVLDALAANFESGEAESLANGERDFGDVESVVAAHATLGESVGVLAVSSDFFRVQVLAEVGDSRAELTSTIHRDYASGALTVLTRSFGNRFETTQSPQPAELANWGDA